MGNKKKEEPREEKGRRMRRAYKTEKPTTTDRCGTGDRAPDTPPSWTSVAVVGVPRGTEEGRVAFRFREGEDFDREMETSESLPFFFFVFSNGGISN